jgi:hypothetical protein
MCWRQLREIVGIQGAPTINDCHPDGMDHFGSCADYINEPNAVWAENSTPSVNHRAFE